MEFVEILDLVQQYTDLQQQLHVELQTGFFGFARHRNHTPIPFSQSFLELECDPTVGVIVSTAAGSAVFEVDDGSGNATKETASDTTGLRNRKQPATSETTTTTSSSTNKNDPLLLFAPLPSQHLRSSQDAFRNAIDLVVRIANLKSQIDAKCG